MSKIDLKILDPRLSDENTVVRAQFLTKPSNSDVYTSRAVYLFEKDGQTMQLVEIEDDAHSRTKPEDLPQSAVLALRDGVADRVLDQNGDVIAEMSYGPQYAEGV